MHRWDLGVSILIAGGDPEGRDEAASALAAEGVALRRVATGDLAVLVACGGEIDRIVVVVDTREDVDLVRRLRALAGARPIVGICHAFDRQATLDAGAVDVADRDAHPRALRAHLLAFLEGRTPELPRPVSTVDSTGDLRLDAFARNQGDLATTLLAEVEHLRHAAHDPEVARACDRVRTLVLEARERARDAVDLHRLERGRFPLRLGLTDVVGTVESAVRDVTATKDAAALSLDLPPHPLRALADEALLRRGVSGLVAVALRSGTPFARVSVATAGSEILVAVEDDGPRVPPAITERVFDGTLSRDAAALIGRAGAPQELSFARCAARAMGGDLRSETPPSGSGARFCWRLPVAPTRQPASPARLQSPVE